MQLLGPRHRQIGIMATPLQSRSSSKGKRATSSLPEFVIRTISSSLTPSIPPLWPILLSTETVMFSTKWPSYPVCSNHFSGATCG